MKLKWIMLVIILGIFLHMCAEDQTAGYRMLGGIGAR